MRRNNRVLLSKFSALPGGARIRELHAESTRDGSALAVKIGHKSAN
jgi:hypothetical protein